jgi:MFS family permease
VALNIALLNSADIQSVSALNQLLENEKPPTWSLYLLAGIGFLVFIFIQRRLGQRQTAEDRAGSPPPLIDLGLFKRPNFSPAIIINFLVGTILIIAMINVPLLINVLEFDLETAALTSGWLLSAMTAAMAVTAYLGGRLTERWQYRRVTWLGLVGCAAGFGFMGLTWEPATPYGQMAWQLAILGAGFGLVTAPIGAAVINAAPEDQRGVASSLVIVLRLMGMSVGLSGLTAWGLYRFNVLRRLTVLPAFDDPGYQTAVVEALTNTTVSVLAETFLISAVFAALAFLVVFRLRDDE